jgi:hypothetical protein
MPGGDVRALWDAGEPQGPAGFDAWGLAVSSYADDAVRAYSISAAEMHSPTAVFTVAGGTPRLVFPDGVTTTAYLGGRGFPVDWLEQGITLGFDWANDHTATGNVRWEFELRENNTGQQLSAADVLVNSQQTIASPGANGVYTTTVAASDVALSPGGFGSLYLWRITRLGGDALDTLGGAVGLLEGVFLPGAL